ncbi:MAG: M55 family metallopeptidase [Chthoniobacterales bacterium]
MRDDCRWGGWTNFRRGIGFKQMKKHKKSDGIKIYIQNDMEGISGIRTKDQVSRDSPDYEEGRKLLMMDLNAAIDGAFAGGATEVVVADCHGGGGQMRIGGMDPRAVYEMPNGGIRMASLDETYTGVILLGYHAMAGTVNGFLDHTMSSAEWFEFKINGQVVGEIGIEATIAAHFNVPVIMVSGDETTGKEARATLGKNTECAVVKWGIGRNKAKCLSLENAHKIIRETTKKAVETAAANPGYYRVFKPKLPVTAELTLYRSDMVDGFAFRPGIERVNARTIRSRIHSLIDIVNWLS